LSEKHLQIVLCEGTKIVQKHYEESILKYLNKSKKNFFIDKHLDEDDWQSKEFMLRIYYIFSNSHFWKLKEITEEILQSLFGVGILEPLETTDQYFKLEVSLGIYL
jgi:hypothetical protein